MNLRKLDQLEQSSRLEPVLHIRLSPDLTPPSPAHRLLLAFHFGSGEAGESHPAIVSPGLAPVSGDSVYECWWYNGDVGYRQAGPIRLAECDDYTVAIFTGDEADSGDIGSFTYDAYRKLLQAVAPTEQNRLVKIWNYLGGINTGEDDEERYRLFSVGRSRAFNALAILDEDAPTGTAIGTPFESGLAIIALASTKDCALAENPRQVSAYHYPRQYGPKSPKFARGGIVSTDDHKLYLISGTAAVVGHESLHPYDVNMQIDETLINIESLCQSVSQLDRDGEQLKIDDGCILRAYLRNTADKRLVADALNAKLNIDAENIVYLHGNICRRELVVEIDGVKVV